ncbi:MAG: TonB-dependent receptor [Bacteroidales bacterium]|nr:TonB-dependent receptor [Bacteroidales bacterium]
MASVLFKQCSVLIVLMAFSMLGFSQELKIYDAETLEPIGNVALYGKDKRHSVISDQNGIADLKGFEGRDSIYFQHPTYRPVIRTKAQLKELGYSIALKKRVIQLKEFVVSAYRWEQNKEEVPNKITTISKQQIDFQNPQTAADLLGTSDEIFIQKSQLGGGSPMIRGFATNSVLLVVDGVRMNNCIYRSGNLHNVISLDPHTIENSEVIFGPGSVTYGSDALGGVMDFHTKSVQLSTSDQEHQNWNVLTRYSSANNEMTGHVDFNYGRRKWGFLTSLSYSSYDDLEMGSHDHPGYRRMEYVKRIDGRDSIVDNENPDKQIPSGYDQFNFMQKFRYRPGSNFNLSYGFHLSSTSNIPRYDRLIQRSNGQLKNAEWYYGPQKWMMHALNGKLNQSGSLFNNMQFTFAFQNYEESRHDRGYKEEWLRHRTENVQALSLNIDFDKEMGNDLLYYGLEYAYNHLNSTAFKEHIVSGEELPTQTRYPNGDNDYSTFAGYISYKKNIGEQFTTITGIRYSHFDIYSTLDTSAAYYNFPFSKMSLSTGALNGSVGLVYRPQEDWQINLNGSSGFHAPNIDDMAKVFDSEPESVVMPNENLEPEYAYNIDWAVKKHLGQRSLIELTGFYTWLQDALVRREATFNGKDSIMYDGVLSQVHKMVNADKAYIHGLSLDFNILLPFNMQFSSNLTYTRGEDDEGVALRHIAPTFGQVSMKYDNKPLVLSVYSRFNGKISNERLAPSEQTKHHMYALNERGQPYSPAWWTLNFKGSYRVNQYLTLNAGVENVLDVRYRPYSSGIAATGRNFMVALRAHF